MVFNFGPAILGHFGGILKWNFGNGIASFCSLISLAQCIDPIATFLFVTEYREAVIRIFKKPHIEPISGYTGRDQTNIANLPEPSTQNKPETYSVQGIRNNETA